MVSNVVLFPEEDKKPHLEGNSETVGLIDVDISAMERACRVGASLISRAFSI